MRNNLHVLASKHTPEHLFDREACRLLTRSRIVRKVVRTEQILFLFEHLRVVRDFKPRAFDAINDVYLAPYSLRNINGVQVAIVGQSFPYTPIANPRWMVPDWTFGIEEERLQSLVETHGHGDVETLRERILRDLEHFTGDAPQHDDMTMLVLKVESPR